MKFSYGTFEKLTQEILLAHLYKDPEISFIDLLENLICLYPSQNWLPILKAIKKLTTINGILSITGIQKKLAYFIDVLLSPVAENEFRKKIRENSETVSLESYFTSKAFKIISEQKMLAGEYKMTATATMGKVEIKTSFNMREKENDLILIPEKKVLTQHDPLYVQYSGLVITAAFLPMFFDAVGLLTDGNFSNLESQVKAVRLTGYLGSGQTDTPDWELVVPKILCGLDPSATITMDEILDQGSLDEAESLLKALIKHWNALGYCSTDGLREGFLDRNGKLTTQADNWLLQVESKAIDILLDRISWSFGTIKLPWMPKMLITEWQGKI